jgi:hypothetical protein
MHRSDLFHGNSFDHSHIGDAGYSEIQLKSRKYVEEMAATAWSHLTYSHFLWLRSRQEKYQNRLPVKLASPTTNSI